MAPSDPDETFDSIPWESLLADPADRRRRLVTAVSIGLALLAISVSLTRTLWPVGGAPPSPTTTEVAVTVGPEARAEPVESAPATTQPPALLSEADLLAVDPHRAMAAAAGFAEWFLAEYFTIDEEGHWGAVAAAALPDAVGPPAPGVRSFVDSVHVLDTEQTGSDTYLVTAVVRWLVDSDGSGYRRASPGHFEVEVSVGAVGPSVAGLPRPAPVPAAPVIDPGWVQVPDPVAAAARAVAGAFGEVAEGPLLGVATERGWLVAVLVSDATGMAWPVEIEVPGPAGDDNPG